MSQCRDDIQTKSSLLFVPWKVFRIKAVSQFFWVLDRCPQLIFLLENDAISLLFQADRSRFIAMFQQITKDILKNTLPTFFIWNFTKTGSLFLYIKIVNQNKILLKNES